MKIDILLLSLFVYPIFDLSGLPLRRGQQLLSGWKALKGPPDRYIQDDGLQQRKSY